MAEVSLELLIAPELLRERVEEMGKRITEDYKGKEPLLIGVLKGVFVFMADLIRFIDLPIKVDFVWASSYRDGTEPGDLEVEVINIPVKSEDVIIVEDIVDSGMTLKRISEEVKRMGANSTRTCVLLDKRSRRKVEVELDYVGFEIPDLFVVGYGLDLAGRYRNLKGIYYLKSP